MQRYVLPDVIRIKKAIYFVVNEEGYSRYKQCLLWKHVEDTRFGGQYVESITRK